MTRSERQLLIRNSALGVMLALLTALAQQLGWLEPLEYWLYDQRARLCQFYAPPPTDALVHLDIDDSSIAAIARWPWDRQVLAEITTEVQRAGAKALAYDVLFSEPQRQRFEVLPDGSAGLAIPDDALFAAALRQYPATLLSTSVKVEEPASALEQDLVTLLTSDLTLSAAAAHDRLGQQHAAELQQVDELAFDDLYLRCRAQAGTRRIEQALAQGLTTFEQVRDALLPGEQWQIIGSTPLLRLLEDAFDRARAVAVVRRSARPYEPQLDPALPVRSELPPIFPLADAARGSGFVTYLPDSDGVVRQVPLWVDDGAALQPQLGLALACAYLGVKPAALKLLPDRVVLPLPDDRTIDIPVHRQRLASLGREVGMIFSIPWFGPSNHWEWMYDPHGRQTRQHIPLLRVWEVRQRVHRLMHNNQQLDLAVGDLLGDDEGQLGLDSAKLAAYRARKLAEDDWQGRAEFAAQLEQDATLKDYVSFFRQSDPQGLSPQDAAFRRTLLLAFAAVQEAARQNRTLAQEIEHLRRELARELGGKACLVGWISTAAIADFVPTSLHSKCPGVIIHGAVFNAILTNHMLRTATQGMNTLVTLLVGLLATLAAARLTPGWALAAAAAIGGGYLTLNGVLLYDYGDYILGAAGPTVAVAAIWALCTLQRFISERAERARITRRFSNYVDPALVRYVVENPDQARLNGESREMTVVFTDLAGFTTLSEKLGENTVPILNEYMGLMVPLIRARRGYVNKFLGDGIMFFFGAPLPNGQHAQDAVAATFAMQQMMITFNRKLSERDLPNVHMRVGIGCGRMIVGDAGSEDASDYTVLGDVVNLSARLESANKYLGTRLLINENTSTYVQHEWLLRPVARLQVVGKQESVMTFEPLAPRAQASPDQLRLAELTVRMVNAFQQGDFANCVQAGAELLAYDPQQSKLVGLYQRWARQYQQTPPEDDFDGRIELTEK